MINAPQRRFAQSGGRIRLAAITAVALLGFVAVPARASAQEVVTPQEDGSYPVLTYFTGECDPEDPLPAAYGSVEQPAYETRTETYTSFFHLGEDPFEPPGPTPLLPNEQVGATDGTHADDTNNVQKADGPCKGDDQVASGGRIGGVPVVQPSAGHWESISYRQRHRYVSCGEDPDCGFQGEWTEDPEFEEGPEIVGTPVQFKIYNPCFFKVKKLKGRAVGTTVGSSKTHQLNEGDLIAGGEIIVREGGQLVVEGGDGVQGIVGPGTYALTTRAACKRLRAPLPKTTPPIKVEEGTIVQKSASEFDSIIQAVKDFYNDGILSRLRRAREPRQDDVQIAYRVTVDAKHKRAKSCAIKGALRVYTTNRKVPAGKREIVLEAGECALAKEGRAPKVVD